MSRIKKLSIALLVGLMMLTITSTAFAHSGRTDSSGGHNCSTKSKSKGLCSGYHYHNSGNSSSSSSNSSSSSKKSTQSNSSKSSKSKSASKSAVHKSEYTLSSVKYYVNNSKVDLSPGPILKDNTYLFPIREVAKSLGAVITMNETESTITIKRDNNEVEFNLKNNQLLVVKDTTYAPIRLIVEGLGATISLDSVHDALYIEIQ